MSKLTKEQEKVDKIAEKIIGVIYTPPPMSPKFLEQEKKKIIPILAKEIKMAEEKGYERGSVLRDSSGNYVEKTLNNE